MKTIKRLNAALIAVLLCAMILAPATAFADGETPTPPAYSVTGTSTSFTQFLVFKSDANVPVVTFNYSIAAGTGISASPAGEGTAAKMEVISPSTATGVTGSPTITADQAAFNTEDTKYTEKQDGDTFTLDSGEAYAKETVTVNFSGVTFTEPGIYRYIITMTSENQQGISYDTQHMTTSVAKQRVLDVYVIDTNGTLSIDKYVLHELVGDVPAGNDNGSEPAANPLDDKSVGFVNEFGSQNLVIGKAVSGNQASRDKYFKFTIEIANAVAGTKYTVDISDADASVAAGVNAATKVSGSNVAEITVPADETSVTAYFYLKNDQSVKIMGLATDSTYSVTEDAEDYKSTPGASGTFVGNLTSLSSTTSGTIADQDVSVGYTNTRNGVVPTGVMLTVVPGVAIVAIALFGLLALKRKKNEA